MRCCPTSSAATCSLLTPPPSQSTRSGLQPCALRLTATLHLAGLVSALLAWTKGAAPQEDCQFMLQEQPVLRDNGVWEFAQASIMHICQARHRP